MDKVDLGKPSKTVEIRGKQIDVRLLTGTLRIFQDQKKLLTTTFQVLQD